MEKFWWEWRQGAMIEGEEEELEIGKPKEEVCGDAAEMG